MRTTVRIDDDLLRDLRGRAQAEQTSLTRIVNDALRLGLSAVAKTKSKKRFRQRTSNMGPPLVDITKALQLAGQLEDEEILSKLAKGK
jgi:hypothetical protein